jgi:phosphotransferase system enzyme I (PtsI)
MNAVSIPKVKKVLRRCSRGEAVTLAQQALTFSTAAEVESYLQSQITARYSESID